MKKILRQRVVIFGILLVSAIGIIFIVEEKYQKDIKTELSTTEPIFPQQNELGQNPSEQTKSEKEKEQSQPREATLSVLPKVLLSATQLEQGDTLVVTVTGVLAGEKIRGLFDKEKFEFFSFGKEGKKIAILGISPKKEPGIYNLSVNFSDGKIIKKEITIRKRKFLITELPLTPELEERGYSPSNIAENIATKDGVLIKEVLSQYTPEVYFAHNFSYPVKTIKEAGAFGNIRKSGDIMIQHLGVDLDVPAGTDVYAVNDGIIVFSQELTVFGKTIIIDHGFGIYSLYLHLEEFKVSKGDRVERGDIIGFSGNTGWSTEPHLHFSIKVKGASVEPLKFIETLRKNIK